MAKFLLLAGSICLAFFVQSTLSLVCSNCNLDCSAPVDEQCLDPGDTQKVACLTETFTDLNNKTGHQRKCVIFQDDIDTFECLQQPMYKTVSCMTCSTDLCNRAVPPSLPSSSSTNKSNVTVIIPGIGTPIGRHYYNLTRPYPLPLPFESDDDEDDDKNDVQQRLENKDKTGVLHF